MVSERTGAPTVDERYLAVHIDERALADQAAAAYERIERTTRDAQAVAAALKPPLTRLSEVAARRV